MEKISSEELVKSYPVWLDSFIFVYQKLSTDNLSMLKDLYHKDVTFIDPMHKVEGFDNLYKYFSNLYQNLNACDFIIDDVVWEDSKASVFWTMSYLHPKLNKGKRVQVRGTSHIKGQANRVIYHRDYLDLGAMLYEQLPIFGKLTKWIKTKATN